jgi:hypothetical protein
MIKIDEDTSPTLRRPINPEQYIVVGHIAVQDPDVIVSQSLVSWSMSAEGRGNKGQHIPAIASRRAQSN